MSGMHVLLLKLSSLGDVIHQFPALTDLRAHRLDVAVDWVVEEAYGSLVRLHPTVATAIPIALRRLRSRPGSMDAWKSLGASLSALRRTRYDWAIDSQGLLKSAILARLARGPRCGYDRASIREPVASLLLDVRMTVSREQHAVDRIRALFGRVFGYAPSGPADYGLGGVSLTRPAWAPQGSYVVALHATSRDDKRWADGHWAELASRLAATGTVVVYPWGNPREREAAERLATQSPSAIVAPPLPLIEASALLRHATAVVGVDTGLAHLAAALGVPTVGIYVATKPGLTGLTGGGSLANLGAPGAAPSAEAVMDALLPALGRA